MVLKKIITTIVLTIGIVFSSSSLDSETSLVQTNDMPVESGSLTKRTALAMHYEGRPTFMAHARHLCDSADCELEKLLEELKACGFKNISMKAELLRSYYPIFDPKEHVRPATFFIEADRLAFRILSNSLQHCETNPTDLIQLLPECCRLFSTTAGDLVSYREMPSCPIYFYNRVESAQSILACILCALDIQYAKPLVENEDALLKVMASLGHPNDWYFNMFLGSCSKVGDEEIRSLLDFDKETVASFNKTPSKKISEYLAPDILMKTELFKILDSKRRNAYIFKFPNLLEYNIYLGSIDDYLSKSRRTPASAALPKPSGTAAAASTTPRKKKKQRQRLTSKADTKQSTEVKITKQTSIAQEIMDLEEQPSTTPESAHEEGYQADEDLKEPFPSSSALVLSATTPAAPTTFTPEDSTQEWTEIARNKKRSVRGTRGNKGKFIIPTLELLQRLCRENQLHYVHFAHVRNISRYIPDSSSSLPFYSYDYNRETISTEDSFAQIRKTITQEHAQNVMRYFAKRDGHQHIRVPNISRFFIVFHLSYKGQNIEHRFVDKDVYISGAQLFKDPGESFRTSQHIKLAYNDSLTPAEQREYWATSEVRQLFLMWSVHNRLVSQIAKGSWLYNALHAESQLLLNLYNVKLSDYISCLSQTYPHAEILGAGLGIASLYECCNRCRNLIQGSQWKLESTLARQIVQLGLESQITLSDNFNSIVLFDEQLKIKHSDDLNDRESCHTSHEKPFLLSPDGACNSKHKLVLINRDLTTSVK